MMTRKKGFLSASTATLASALALPLLFPANAHAFAELDAIAGASLLQGPAHSGLTSISPLVGGSFLFSILPFIEIGPTYENNFIFNNGSLGHRSYLGGTLRFNTASILFIDGTLGVSSINYGQGGGTSDGALAGGFDVGLNLSQGMGTSVSPFVGYRYTPTKWGATSVDGSTIDFGLMIGFGL